MATVPTGRKPPAPAVEPPTADPKKGFRKYWRLYAAISPFYLLFLAFGLVPVGFSLYLSFHRWDGLGSMEWAGLSQYKYLLSDTDFWNSIGNTIIIWALATFPMIFLAMVTAVMLNSAVRFKNVYRFAYFLPNVTSVVAIAIVFGSVFSTNFGLVNALLQAVGIDQVAWLNTPWGIKVAIATLMTWQWTGYNAIIFLAGLQTIPGELYEAARMDGAGPVQTFFRITLPLLRPDAAVRPRDLDGHRAAELLRTPGAAAEHLQRLDVLRRAGPRGPDDVPLLLPADLRQQRLRLRRRDGLGHLPRVVIFSIINWRLVQRRGEDREAGTMAYHPRHRDRRPARAPAPGRRPARRPDHRRAALGVPVLLGRHHVDAHLDGDLLLSAQAAARRRTSWRTSSSLFDNIDFFGSMFNSLLVAVGDVPRAVLRLAGRLRLRQVRLPGQEGAVRAC